MSCKSLKIYILIETVRYITTIQWFSLWLIENPGYQKKIEEYKWVCSSLIHGNFHGFTGGMVKREHYECVCSSLVHGNFHGFNTDYKKVWSSVVHGNFHGFNTDYKKVWSSIVHGNFHGFTSGMVNYKIIIRFYLVMDMEISMDCQVAW